MEASRDLPRGGLVLLCLVLGLPTVGQFLASNIGYACVERCLFSRRLHERAARHR